VDFHLHSNCSDGSDVPAEVVRRAAAMGMRGLALTDHDSVRGLEEAAASAKLSNLGFVKGVEISAGHGSVEVHVIGLGIDPSEGLFRSTIAALAAGRARRFLDMARRLQETGLPVLEYAEGVLRKGEACGRMNLAAHLREKGITKTVQEGFDRYLKPGGAGYVAKPLVSVDIAVDAVHAAGGLAFVAHPGLSKGLLRILPELLARPFDGIEAYHVSHSAARVEELLRLARTRGLYVSGGSDCHGNIKGHAPEMGRVRVPLAVVRPLLERVGHDDWGVVSPQA
jgi:predicted metal-dependent phosphoesterase TrpH